MIKFLKKNTPLNYLLIFIILLVFWAYNFIYSPTSIEPYIIYSPLFPTFPESNFYLVLQNVLGFIIYFILALYIIKVNSDLFFVENGYQSPGIIFALLSGYYINTQRISAILIASFLFFISIVQILKSGNKLKGYDNMFNSGFMFCLSFLFYPKIIFLLPILILAVIINKTIIWREPVFFITGFINALILYLSYLLLKYNLDYTINEVKSIIDYVFLKIPRNFINIFILILLPQTIFFVIAIISRYLIYHPLKVSTRKYLNILIVTSVYLLIFVLSPLMEIESIILIYPAISILLAFSFVNYKQKTSKIIFTLFVLSIILTQSIQIYYYSKIF